MIYKFGWIWLKYFSEVDLVETILVINLWHVEILWWRWVWWWVFWKSFKPIQKMLETTILLFFWLLLDLLRALRNLSQWISIDSFLCADILIWHIFRVYIPVVLILTNYINVLFGINKFLIMRNLNLGKVIWRLQIWRRGTNTNFLFFWLR